MAKRAPVGLGAGGRKLWRETLATYDLRADELRILEDACREADLIDRLEDELEKGELLSTGSQGQPVISPFVAEIRQHRTALKALIVALKLPDEAAAANERSASARRAAEARWKRVS